MSIVLALLLAATVSPASRLNKAPKEVEQARQGQAKLADPTGDPDAAWDAAEDTKRDEMIAELQRIVPRVPEGAGKADLYFQLAELWWEKARYTALLEGKAFDETWAAWSASKTGPEPKIDARGSEKLKQEALSLYRSVLDQYPGYGRRDEVLFVIGYNLYEAGQKQEGVKSYQALIQQYPDSKAVPDAYVQLGEHYFAANDLAHARAAFEKAASFKLPKLYAFSLYKLAWCDFNAGDVKAAIAKFHEVIAYADQQGATAARDRIQLKTEALKDLVVAYAQVDSIDPAAAYFHEKGGAQAVDLLNKLAAQYFEDGKFEQSIRVYRMLQAEAPDHLRAPTWSQKILLAYDKLHRRDEVAAEMKQLVNRYGPKSAWAKVNAGHQGALDDASELAETALRELVQDYHQEAIKTKSVATYRLARDIYKQYLDTFPSSETAYSMRFYFAEILYALEEWDAAADQYGRVAEAKGQLAAKAAYDAILALEKSVAIAKGKLKKRELADAAKIDEKKAKGEVEGRRIELQKITRETREEAIPENEGKLIAACERYLTISPGARDEIVIRYKAAFVYYEHRHFVEAARRFGEIILRWPKDSWSQKAADLSLDILNTKEEWLALSELSHRFRENHLLAPPGSEFEKRVAKIGEGAKFKYVMEVYERKQDFPLAAKEFQAFVSRYPRSEHAPKALYNSLFIADKADQLDVEIAAGEQLLRDYPKADPAIVLLTVPALASAAERAARFADAVRWYEEGVRRWPKDPRAPDWLYNASLLREGLGDDEGALRGWRRYLRAFPGRPDVAKIAFNVGLIVERQKDAEKTAAAWAAFQREQARRALPAQLVLARYKEALALRQLRSPDAAAALEDVAGQFGQLADGEKAGPAADAAAHARFLAIEGAFDQFMAIHFNYTRQRDLLHVLKVKNARLNKLLDAYAKVIEVGSAKWSEAAFTRMGQAYRNFNKGLLDAPMPRGLDPEQQDLYRSTLESQALPLEDKAVEAFRKAIEASTKSGVYTEWTVRAQDSLRELQPDSFGDVREPPFADASLARPVSPDLAGKGGT